LYKNRTKIFESLCAQKGQIAVLIDPEKTHTTTTLISLIKKAEFAGVRYFFVGGSTVSRKEMQTVVEFLKKNTCIPVVIFPGSSEQIAEADAILLLSLISGRNPDFLIGHHVAASMELHQLEIEVLPTAYILIDGGTQSSVAYVSQTSPIPSEQEAIALRTAIAGAQLGLHCIYFDAGSGAKRSVPPHIINIVKKELPNFPIIVGGGIRSMEAVESYSKDANVIVIGNHIEENPEFLLELQAYLQKN